jgi:DNA ligase-associated metallophosphoesterase
MFETRLAGEAVRLHPNGAVVLPAQATVLVADAHFGKAVSFRRLGVPVPRGTTAETLDQLSTLVAGTRASRIVFLGDFLHSKRSHAAGTLDAIRRWRAEHAQLDLTLVRGNHDARAGDPPADLGIEAVDEPLPLGPFALCHHPRPVSGKYVLCGHWHPCVSVKGRAFERLRLPCFWFGDDSGARPDSAVGVLPAFGAFTGMHSIERRAGDRVFPVAGQVVRELPAMPADAGSRRG